MIETNEWETIKFHNKGVESYLKLQGKSKFGEKTNDVVFHHGKWQTYRKEYWNKIKRCALKQIIEDVFDDLVADELRHLKDSTVDVWTRSKTNDKDEYQTQTDPTVLTWLRDNKMMYLVFGNGCYSLGWVFQTSMTATTTLKKVEDYLPRFTKHYEQAEKLK